MSKISRYLNLSPSYQIRLNKEEEEEEVIRYFQSLNVIFIQPKKKMRRIQQSSLWLHKVKVIPLQLQLLLLSIENRRTKKEKKARFGMWMMPQQKKWCSTGYKNIDRNKSSRQVTTYKYKYGFSRSVSCRCFEQKMNNNYKVCIYCYAYLCFFATISFSAHK